MNSYNSLGWVLTSSRRNTEPLRGLVGSGVQRRGLQGSRFQRSALESTGARRFLEVFHYSRQQSVTGVGSRNYSGRILLPNRVQVHR